MSPTNMADIAQRVMRKHCQDVPNNNFYFSGLDETKMYYLIKAFLEVMWEIKEEINEKNT